MICNVTRFLKKDGKPVETICCLHGNSSYSEWTIAALLDDKQSGNIHCGGGWGSGLGMDGEGRTEMKSESKVNYFCDDF